jgi:outer membrane protein assembly factor BamB
MTRLSAILVSIVGLVIATAFLAMGADWPQWRGENRAAKATDFKAPQTWPKELTQKWKTVVGDGDATPSLAGDKLYVFAMQDGNEVLRCLNAASGQELWQDKYEAQGATGPASGHKGPRASPTVVEGKVVTLGVRGMLSCLDAESGKVLWRKDDFRSVPSFFTSSSPIVVDGLCIAQLGGQSGGGVVAYELASGEEKWKWTGDSPAYASPALMTLDGRKFIVAITAGKLVALAASSGELAWETQVGGGGRGGRGRGGEGGGRRRGPDGAGQKRGDGDAGEQRGPAGATVQQEPGQKRGEGGRGRGGRGGGGGMGAGGRYNASTPVVDGQTIYYVLPGGMKAVKLEKQGDKLIGKEVWSNTETTIEYNTPVLKDGLLFGLTAANRFFCVNTETGKAAWIGPGGQAGGGGRGGQGGYGSVVDAGSVLLAITPGAELVVIEPTDKTYNELARIKVADSPTYAHLVVAGNRLFVKDKDSVAMLTVD